MTPLYFSLLFYFMSWATIHKWSIRYCDSFELDEEEFEAILQENSVNERTQSYLTPLHFAALGKYPQVAKLLIKNGAKIQLRDVTGATPLHYAVHSGNLPVILLLLKEGANDEDIDDDGNSLLHWAVQGGCIKVVKFFLDLHPTLVNEENYRLELPIDIAINNEDNELIQLLDEDFGGF